MQGVKSESLADFIVRQPARQRGEQIAFLRQLLLKRRKRLPRLGKGRFLCCDRVACNLPQFHLPAYDRKRIGDAAYRLLRRRDLPPQRSFLDGGRYDIRGQREPRGIQLVTLCFRLRL